MLFAVLVLGILCLASVCIVGERRVDDALNEERQKRVLAHISVDVEANEALVFEHVLLGVTKILTRSFHIVALSVRASGDTLSGIVSGVIRSIGGLFNLVADSIAELSLPLLRPRAPDDRMPHLLDHIGRKVGRGLKAITNVLFAIGGVCIMTGEATEVLTLGLGQAVEDSFLGLEYITLAVQKNVQSLLHPKRAIGSRKIMMEVEEKEQRDQRFSSATFVEPKQAPLSLIKSESNSYVENGKGSRSTTTTFDFLQEMQASFNASTYSNSTSTSTVGLRDRAQASTFWAGVAFLRSVLFAQEGGVDPFEHSLTNILGIGAQPSIRSHVGACFIILVIATFLCFGWGEKKPTGCGLFFLLMTMAGLWTYIIVIDVVLRKKMEMRLEARTVGVFFKQQMETANKQTRVGELFESSLWVNTLLSSVWSIDGDGGLGPYIGSIIEELLQTELAQVPPGVANLQLKRFHLGSLAPIVKAIRLRSRRELICLAGNAKKKPSTLHQHESFSWSKAKSSSGDVRSGGCEHVVADIDFAYLSKDMDILLSLRSADIKSVLPEVTVKLSEVSLSGIMRLDTELTPDYPFFGNATLSFLELPLLDLAISSFGGVDLAAFPGVYNWLNITVVWLLDQYTMPRTGAVDLRHTICPLCDAEDLTTTTSKDLLVEAIRAIGKGIEHIKRTCSHWISVRMRRLAQTPVNA